MLRYACLGLITVFTYGCGSDSVECLDSQALYKGRCEARVLCGPGTHAEGPQCTADTPELTCGEGTIEQDGACVGSLDCGLGTMQIGDECIPGTTVQCGTGTSLINDVCVADAIIMCGPGTELVDDECVPDGTNTSTVSRYDIRIDATELPADGYSATPVLVIGRNPDGTPSMETVVLTLDRPGAGTLEETTITLAELGSVTYYRTCSSADDPACIGSVRVRVALQGDPDTILAESQALELVEPAGVGTTAPCESYNNALFFDGDGYIFTGQQLVTQASFNANGSNESYVGINIDPTMSSQGSWWDARFEAPDGMQLYEQVYPIATRYPFQDPGEAGLSVTGDGRGCNRSSGTFEVHRLVLTNGEVDEFTATFEQSCENNSANWLRGCVKFTR